MILLSKWKRLRQIGGIAETFNLLALRLLIKDRIGFRRYPGIMLRSYAALGGPCPWQTRAIAQICPEVEGRRIRLEHIPTDDWSVSTSVAELAHLALLTQALRPKVIFEIGTYTGRTALNFALNAPDECLVYTMDLPPDNKPVLPGAADRDLAGSARPDRDYRKSDVVHKIRQIYANSILFDFSPFEKSVDLFFVDGGHHYDAVVSDTRNALRSVKPGGMIVWHDFANYGDFADVTRGILDLIPRDRVFQIEDTQLAVYCN